MTAALALADQGFKTHLIERSDRLGGNLLTLNYTLEHDDISGFTSDLVKRVSNHPNIELHMEAEVKNVAGFIGSFQVTVASKGSRKQSRRAVQLSSPPALMPHRPPIFHTANRTASSPRQN